MDTSMDLDTRKVPIEDLSKEEIIKKYTSLRSLLQKVKSVKDALTEDNTNLREQLTQYTDMQDVVEKLTEQKLNIASELEECKLKVKHLEDKLHGSQQQCAKVVILDTENEGYKRQISRLTQENEELISNLNNYEKELNSLKSVNTQQEQQLNELNVNNGNLIQTNEDLANEILNNTTIISNLKATIEEKDKSIESYISSTDDLNIELHKNRALVEKLKQDIATMNSKLNDNQIVSSGVTSDLQNVNERLKEKIKNYHQKIVKFAGDVKILKQNRLEILHDVKIYVKQVNAWKDQLSTLQLHLQNQIESSRTIELENERLKVDNKEISQKLAELESAHAQKVTYVNSHAQTDENCDLGKINAELLGEMNEMNQILKERGESISKLQEYNEELIKQIKNCEIINAQLKSQVNNQIHHQSGNETDLQKLLKEKDDELGYLHAEINQLKEKNDSYAESEVMSTSTISHTEDMSRLKDIETSWEERYGKLRNLAVKLKAKVRDLTQELTDNQQRLNAALQSVHSLQSQCDSLQDQLDREKQSNVDNCNQLKAIVQEFSECKKQLAENQEIIGKQKREIEQLNNEKQQTIEWKKQVGGKVQNLKKELEANALIKKDFENQIARLKSQLDLKEQQIHELEVKNSQQELNKQSVLTLEMQDYERSLKELKNKLEKKTEYIGKLKNQIDAEKHTSGNLKEEKRLLDERIQYLDADLNSARAEIASHKKNFSDLEALLHQKDEQLHKATCDLETSRAENEDLATQLSKLVSEQQKNVDDLKTEREYLRSSNLGLEEKLRQMQQQLVSKETMLEQTLKEYETYKVRAQSVLKQNQTRDVGLEEKLSEKAASLDAQVKVLLAQIEESKTLIENQKQKNEFLSKVNAELQKQQEDAIIQLDEQEQKFQELFQKHQKSIIEHNEAIRVLKVHSETLAQCFRQQLSEQETRHNREIIELQSKLDSSSTLHVDTSNYRAYSNSPPVREEGEGSENTDGGSTTKPTPLERLLSNDTDVEFGFIRKQLNENERKVQHLTALLADTEQDLAKHMQMNKLLKEEIRRQQRSVEREQHAENLEYLKNVVYKFITLANGDERIRLVPVLNTILKFSPDEMQKLNAVARGDVLKGWSNFLPPLWSTPK